MALGESIKAWRRGESFTNVLGYLAVSQEEIDRGRAADTALEEMNRKAFARGKITQAELDRRSAVVATQSTDAIITDPESGMGASIVSGLSEGIANVQSTVKESIRAPINFGFGMIPWQAWLILAVYLAYRFGLFEKLKAKIS